MKIRNVRARLLTAKPQEAVVFGIGQYADYSMVLVEVESEDGQVGHGEAIARRGGAMTAAAVNNLLAEVLIGQPAENIEGLWVAMVSRLRRWGHTAGVVMEAISGVDCALWDLLGRSLGMPVWQLLTGAGRTHVPVYASSVYINDVETMVSDALEQQRHSFTQLKVKVGRPDCDGGQDADLDALRAIRDSVGDRMTLFVDANGAYNASGAIRMARRMEPLDIRWFEEPLPPDDVEGYARLHRMTATPLARGETDFGMFTMADVINRRLIDVVQPDLGRCGGITGARHLWTLALASNLSFAPHTGFSGGLSQLAAIHAAAAAPTLLCLEYMYIDNPLREIFTIDYPKPSMGGLEVPQGPGFGLDLDPDLIDSFTVRLDSSVRQ